MRLETFFTVSEHMKLFFLSIILGAALGVLFDCFRVFRILFPPAKKKCAVHLLDILFWLCYGFAIFTYSVVLGRGQVRFFYFAGSMIGFVLYIVSVGNLVVGIIRVIINSIYNLLHKVYSFTIEPCVKFMIFFRQKILVFFVRSHKVEKKQKEVSFPS